MKFEQSLVEAHIFRIKNEQIEFLLLKRAASDKYPNIWQPITGTINEGEKAFQTAIREIKEETGIDVESIFVVPALSGYYSYEKDMISMIPVFSVKVNEDQIIKISNEHSEYGWYILEEAEKLVAWDDQRKSMRLIYERFISSKSNLKFIEIRI